MIQFEDSDIDEDDYKGGVQTLLRMSDCKIKEVWADNFDEEAKKMMKLCETFNVIAMVNFILPRTQNSPAFASVVEAVSTLKRKMNIIMFEEMCRKLN